MELDSNLSEWIQARLNISTQTTPNGCFVDRFLAENSENPFRGKTGIMYDLEGQWNSADRIGKLLVNSLSRSSYEESAQGTLLYGEKLSDEGVKRRSLDASFVDATVNVAAKNVWCQPAVVDHFKVSSSVPDASYSRKAAGIVQKDETDVWHRTATTTMAMAYATHTQMPSHFQPAKIDDGTALWHKSHFSTGPSQISVPPTWNFNTKVHPQSHLSPSDEHISTWKPPHQASAQMSLSRNRKIPLTRSQLLQKLMAMGFQKEHVQAALIHSNMDLTLALAELLSNQSKSPSGCRHERSDQPVGTLRPRTTHADPCARSFFTSSDTQNPLKSQSHGSGVGKWGRDTAGTIIGGSEVSILTPVPADVGRFGSSVSAVSLKLPVDSRDGGISQVGADISLANMYSACSNLSGARTDVTGLNVNGCGRDYIASPSSKESQTVQVISSVGCSELPENSHGGIDEDRCAVSFASSSSYAAACPVISEYIAASNFSSHIPAEGSSVVSRSSSAVSAIGTSPSFINKVYDSGSFGIHQQSDILPAVVDQNLTACGTEADMNDTKKPLNAVAKSATTSFDRLNIREFVPGQPWSSVRSPEKQSSGFGSSDLELHEQHFAHHDESACWPVDDAWVAQNDGFVMDSAAIKSIWTATDAADGTLWNNEPYRHGWSLGDDLLHDES